MFLISQFTAFTIAAYNLSLNLNSFIRLFYLLFYSKFEISIVEAQILFIKIVGIEIKEILISEITVEGHPKNTRRKILEFLIPHHLFTEFDGASECKILFCNKIIFPQA